MKNKLTIQFSPTRLKQIKKIALSGSKAKLTILNGQLEEGFQILKITAQKFKSFATDLADRIPQALAARISLDLFSYFEAKSSKRLGIPKGIVLGGVLALMASLPTVGQTIDAPNTAALVAAINTANGNAAAGIIHLEQGTLYILTGTNLPSIVATGTGGTLQIICTGTSPAIIDGAGANRPLTMLANSDLTISNITIQNGFVANGNGGGIYNNSGDLTISNSIITNNEATGVVSTNGRGAGIYSTGLTASVLIQNSTISLNSASYYGGGIHNRDSSLLTISNSFISENTANKGGGIYNRNSDNLSISSSSISGNASADRGGGIYNRNSDNLSISSSSISGNTSGNRGGGICNFFSNNISISSSSISGNSADKGGGVYNLSSANLSISNSSISGNTSANKGGGIYNRNSANLLSISSSSISGNTSANVGGGVYNRNSDMTIQASSITLNLATTRQGGGIYIKSEGADAVSIINTTISSNEASTTAGGAIGTKSTGVGNTLTLQHVTISNNSGTVTGGFANDAASTLSINLENTIIANSIGTDFDLGGASIIVTASIIESSITPITSATVIDPLLGALTLNSGFLVHPLQVGSPAIDAGANIGISTDQVGNVRVLANPAIGAVEITTASLVCMVVSAPAGVTNTWIGCTNSDWGTASNWSTGAVPTASDVVYVPIEAVNQLIIDEVATCAKLVVQIGAKCLVNYNAGGKLVIKF
jgi:hypothetical protein